MFPFMKPTLPYTHPHVMARILSIAMLSFATLCMAFLSTSCSNEEEISGVEGVTTAVDVDGTWVAQSAAGEAFSLNLNQRGASVTGDSTINGNRVGVGGELQGNVLVAQLFSDPPLNLAATVGNGVMQDGRITDSFGNTVTSFIAEKR